ncbi:LytTR family DNA-binding domain-containing protein [Chitinophaga sp. XS-30]|uniref:LytR/AlgR family response regulator transcription factor n=1 Tax=Chitinophaga sp. XS-30 TaxID=2604421 RepID=UPI0011DCFF4C|nr:LytTR family DNA-binding domain-containing protein [Chitinophaga sp. XS-30]QEH42995.1 response regulator transcription factor [Chitinophaga sp. XS-30]
MINAIIIDDEAHCIERLERLLRENCDDTVRLLGSCTTFETGEEAIARLKPELIFLDIQLHDKSGFDLLQKIDLTQARVIFTTAFEQYAITAFKFSATDYLLKPVDREELIRSVQKAGDSMERQQAAMKYEALLHNLKPGAETAKKICLPTAQGVDFVLTSDIIRCQSSGNYTVFFLNNGQKITVARTLKEYESLLEAHQFFRVHHSHLVNLAYVKKYHRGKGGYVVLADDTEIEVSVRRREAFLERIAM